MTPRVDYAAEDKLLRDALTGGSEELGVLLMFYRPRMYWEVRQSLARWRLQRDTEDVTEDSLCDAIKSWPTYSPQGGGSIKRWLTTIARHTAIRHALANRVAMNEISLTEPEEDEDEDNYRVSPLDIIARDQWVVENTAQPAKPQNMSLRGPNKKRSTYKPKSVATVGKGCRKKLSMAELKKREAHRIEYATTITMAASGLP